MTKPALGAVRGRPIGSTTKLRTDPDDEGYSPPKPYFFWIDGPPYLTDDPHPVAPDALTPLYLPLISFGWRLIRNDYAPPPSAYRAKAPDVLSTLYYHPSHPGVTLGELTTAFAVASPGSIYLHLNRLAKENLVLVEYRKDGERLYTAVPRGGELPPPKKLSWKYAWSVSQNKILLTEHDKERTRLDALVPQLIKFDWAVKRCEVGRTHKEWNTDTVTNEDVLAFLFEHPWSSLKTLIDLYRRHTLIDWAPHEFTYAEENMKRKLYHLKKLDLIIERDGLYNLAGEPI